MPAPYAEGTIAYGAGIEPVCQSYFQAFWGSTLRLQILKILICYQVYKFYIPNDHLSGYCDFSCLHQCGNLFCMLPKIFVFFADISPVDPYRSNRLFLSRRLCLRRFLLDIAIELFQPANHFLVFVIAHDRGVRFHCLLTQYLHLFAIKSFLALFVGGSW